ncbi:MAG: oligosaccharide flippase family protein [Rhodothermales bacterium]|nr:oligosaccharide flippase family protein [Rhodothermales bacterium]MBO6780755.1 oligosaccharide flippase family protein [Rhodothermales bacterium]
MLLRLARKGLVELISANFLMQFVGFGLLILLPRLVTEAEIGQIKLLQTWTDLLVIVAGLGMNTAILKLCSDRRPVGEKQALLRFASVRTAAWSVAVVALVWMIAQTGLLSSDPVVSRWLPVYAVIVPFSALALLAAAYLQALKEIRAMARAQVLVRLQSVAIILLATWQFGLPGFVYSSLAAFAAALWPYVRLIGLDFLRIPAQKASATFRAIAGWSVLGNVTNTIGKYADIYVLGLFALDPVQLGYYSLATIFVIPASVVTSSIQTIVTPYLSEGSTDRTWFTNSLVRTQLQTVLVAVGAALLARAAATVVVFTLYDPGYQAVLPFLDVLLVFFVLRSAYSVVASGHIALGLTRYNFIASAIMAVVALTLTYLALQRFGFEGVAWAKVITAALMIGVYALLARRAVRRMPEAPMDGGPA